ncbi:Uma2 family endonuclease [Nocardioides sp.]|uniref:Uma2 family endonuclease n=1 Tax=Nocardioides sp. TaxID=35761 RepID=UPI0027162809|nr:Uma2 family endonuclease [Nocardioides sp.]MDO9456958.1 Uma2 family endonuclease [Nocardioides sp.]
MTTLPRGREFTRADLDAMPDDGNRYELVDGSIIVTPSPKVPHQRAQRRLDHLIEAACPEGFEIFVAPLDVTLGERTVVQPDLLVTTSSQVSGLDHEGVPLLAVEILSPSTRHIDLGLKRSSFEKAGVPSYWVVDPAEPSIIAWELVDDRYVEVGRATGAEALTVERPFPVTVVPDLLVR